MKNCKKCGKPKDDSEYYGTRTTCKQCMIENRAEWAKNNRNKTREHNQKSYNKKLTLLCWCVKNVEKKKANPNLKEDVLFADNAKKYISIQLQNLLFQKLSRKFQKLPL